MEFKEKVILAVIAGCFAILAAYISSSDGVKIIDSGVSVVNGGTAISINNGNGNSVASVNTSVIQTDNRVYSNGGVVVSGNSTINNINTSSVIFGAESKLAE